MICGQTTNSIHFSIEVSADLSFYIVESDEETLTPELVGHSRDMRDLILKEIGITIPGIRFRINEFDLPNGTYVLEFMEIPLESKTISLEKRLFPGNLGELTNGQRNITKLSYN